MWKKERKRREKKYTVHNFYNSISSITGLFGATATHSKNPIYFSLYVHFVMILPFSLSHNIYVAYVYVHCMLAFCFLCV